MLVLYSSKTDSRYGPRVVIYSAGPNRECQGDFCHLELHSSAYAITEIIRASGKVKERRFMATVVCLINLYRECEKSVIE